jgi:glycosyltransferase involved in cell wall biosynthesis
MRIAITGTRGVPNNYGGFEQCAERLAVLLAQAGHEVTVYNPHYHEYDKSEFHGVKIIKQWNPEMSFGTVGNFIYDYKCMRHAIKMECDILLVLGYTTASLFYPFFRKRKSILVTNMDGLEWKRGKWNYAVKKFAKWLEKLGVRYSDHLISDNREIKNYFLKEYHVDSTFIAYGADAFTTPDESILITYGVEAYQYNLIIARLEKENNIETMLDGVLLSKYNTPYLIVGKTNTPYGEFLIKKYKESKHIRFMGGVYKQDHLNNLRHFGKYYIHGHSVGGTNPSLLEAMVCGAYILAHDNLFNRDVLGDQAWYFDSPQTLASLLNDGNKLERTRDLYVRTQMEKIKREYNWQEIADQYESFFRKILASR